MTVTVTRDEAANVLKNIKTFAGKGVLVGIPEDQNGRGEGIGNAALGFIHENGSPARNIPARPFLLPGVTKAMPDILQTWKAFTKAGLTDESAVDKGLEAVGLQAQAAVKKQIVSQDGFMPLSHKTIAARKSKGYQGEKALIRTGQLLNSINYVVKD